MEVRGNGFCARVSAAAAAWTAMSNRERELWQKNALSAARKHSEAVRRVRSVSNFIGRFQGGGG